MSSDTVKSAKGKGIPFTDIQQMLERAMDDRFEVIEQASFFQLKGPNNHRLYVSKSKTVRRVDLAFEPPFDGLLPPRAANGSIKKELDTSLSDALATLEAIVNWMKDAPVIVAEKRQAFVPTLPRAVAARRAQEPKGEEGRRSRAELIAAEAARQGVQVSRRTLEEFQAPVSTPASRENGIDLAAGVEL
jgi:hypothetical protein